ncbi:hypothetical protein PR048_032530 [Dryococelus australis]|uniref:Uncharacterized protein n=1 Tax=Dryococelus australis TaxID=614101 RepID=A0ABQ9G6J3_9NEOP|nr:hypothetical protein PR048_032530 [Dryococelus australis]
MYFASATTFSPRRPLEGAFTPPDNPRLGAFHVPPVLRENIPRLVVLEKKWGLAVLETILEKKWGLAVLETVLEKKWSLAVLETVLEKKWSLAVMETILEKKWGLAVLETVLEKKWGLAVLETILEKKWGLAVLETWPFVLRKYVYVDALGRLDTSYTSADLSWRSRLRCHRSGVQEALGSNPGQDMCSLYIVNSLYCLGWTTASYSCEGLTLMREESGRCISVRGLELVNCTSALIDPALNTARGKVHPLHPPPYWQFGPGRVPEPTGPFSSPHESNTSAIKSTVYVLRRLACSPPTKAIRVQSPAGSLRISHVGLEPDDVVGQRVFSGISGFPALSFRRCSILTSITLIGSQDLDVKSRLNLFTPLTSCQQRVHHRQNKLSRSRRGKESAMMCCKGPFRNSPGLNSGNHGNRKSGWQDTRTFNLDTMPPPGFLTASSAVKSPTATSLVLVAQSTLLAPPRVCVDALNCSPSLTPRTSTTVGYSSGIMHRDIGQSGLELVRRSLRRVRTTACGHLVRPI